MGYIALTSDLTNTTTFYTGEGDSDMSCFSLLLLSLSSKVMPADPILPIFVPDLNLEPSTGYQTETELETSRSDTRYVETTVETTVETPTTTITANNFTGHLTGDLCFV